jgi:hypothetical protein
LHRRAVGLHRQTSQQPTFVRPSKSGSKVSRNPNSGTRCICPCAHS